MKLSQYAKQIGISYKTAWRWYKAGTLDAYKTETGMVIVRDARDPQPLTGRIALYARVSSLGQKEDVERQIARLQDYAAAKGYQGAKEVTEIASGLNDQRQKREKLLADVSIGTIVVENRDRLTRFGSHSIETLLNVQGRRIEMIFASDTGDELVDDFVAMITSMIARIYGRRQSLLILDLTRSVDANAALVAAIQSKRRAEKIKHSGENVLREEISEEEETAK